MDTGAHVLPSAGMSLCTLACHSQPGQGLRRPLLQMETLRLQEAALLTLWSLPRVRTVRDKGSWGSPHPGLGAGTWPPEFQGQKHHPAWPAIPSPSQPLGMATGL